MVSVWKDTVERPPNSKFDEFLELYQSFVLGKTSYPTKLKVRVNKEWNSFSKEEKLDFTHRLTQLDILDPLVVKAIQTLNATISSFG